MVTLNDLYRIVLNRAPDQGGYDWWQNYMGETVDPDEIDAFVAAAQAELPGATYTPPSRSKITSTRQSLLSEPVYTPEPVIQYVEQPQIDYDLIYRQQAEAQRQAELQRQAEIQRQAEAQQQAEAQRQADLAAQAQLQAQAASQASGQTVNQQDISTFLAGVYRDQLGREPDAGGLQFYVDQISKGLKTQEQVIAELNQSLEGQNYDTQVLTSNYRSIFGRNPEQEGYQYWMSRVQSDPAISAAVVDDYLRGGATGTDIVAMQSPQQFTEMMVSALEADPWAGRRATQDIYNVPADAANVSMMGSQQVAFVNPVTQAPIISTYDPTTGTYTFKEGNRTLSPDRVAEAINIARGSGALSDVAAEGLMNQLQFATPETIYDVLATPQAGVVIDPRFGMQIGEDADMAAARLEAAQRQAVLDQMNVTYPPAYDTFTEQLAAANLPTPFAPTNYAAPTLERQYAVITPENFGQRLGETINRSFAGSNFLGAPVSPGFYSERGFEPSFVPFGAGQPVFRSGVAGYTPMIPQGFQFGMPGVQTAFNTFVPGEFDPGVVDEEGNWKPSSWATAQEQARQAQLEAQQNDPNLTPTGAEKG